MMQRTIPHRQKLTFAPDFLMSSFTKRQPYSAASNLLFAFYFVFIKVFLTITNPACKNPNFCTTVLKLLLARLVVLCFLITPILCADYRTSVADYPV